MANNNDIRVLMEEVLPRIIASNPATSDTFVQRGHVTVGLVTALSFVLSIKRLLSLKRWIKFCVTSFSKALSSHEMYLRYVMFTCEIEIELSDNVFERIVSVCALVISYTTLTFQKTGVDFRELAVDAFMVFYKRFLRKPFYRKGGFVRFEEYLLKEYCTLRSYLKVDTKDSELPKEDYKYFLKNSLRNFRELHGNDPYKLEKDTHDDIIKNIRCHKLAKEVLSTTKIKLPSLPSSDELSVRIRRIAQSSEKSETPPAEESKRESTAIVMQSSWNYQVTDSVEDEANIAWCNDIVRKVTMYNNSNRPDPDDANDQIQKDLDKILEHLKNTIKRLIEVLDDYD